MFAGQCLNNGHLQHCPMQRKVLQDLRLTMDFSVKCLILFKSKGNENPSSSYIKISSSQMAMQLLSSLCGFVSENAFIFTLKPGFHEIIRYNFSVQLPRTTSVTVVSRKCGLAYILLGDYRKKWIHWGHIHFKVWTDPFTQYAGKWVILVPWATDENCHNLTHWHMKNESWGSTGNLLIQTYYIK